MLCTVWIYIYIYIYPQEVWVKHEPGETLQRETKQQHSRLILKSSNSHHNNLCSRQKQRGWGTEEIGLNVGWDRKMGTKTLKRWRRWRGAREKQRERNQIEMGYHWCWRWHAAVFGAAAADYTVFTAVSLRLGQRNTTQNDSHCSHWG